MKREIVLVLVFGILTSILFLGFAVNWSSSLNSLEVSIYYCIIGYIMVTNMIYSFKILSSHVKLYQKGIYKKSLSKLLNVFIHSAFAVVIYISLEFVFNHQLTMEPDFFFLLFSFIPVFEFIVIDERFFPKP